MELETKKGTVRSGRGDHAQWIEKLRDHYLRLTGVSLFPGTLNVEVADPWSMPAESSRLNATDYGGRVTILTAMCRINGLDAWVLRTEANNSGDGDHPQTIVEIASEVRLRDAFGLQDGDDVILELPV